MELLHLQFVESSQLLTTALPSSYNYLLVALSVFISSLAAYVAFLFSEQLVSKNTSRFEYRFWLLAGAVSLGAGIWGMHFIGMMAYKLPININYDAITTLISVCPAVFAGIIVLRKVKSFSIRILIIRSFVLGISIGLMHYIGMAAMRVDAEMLYYQPIFLLSIAVAILLSGVALSIKEWFKKNQGSLAQILASLMMGMAISGMHYTGMAAVYFFPSEGRSSTAVGLEPNVLITMIAVVILVVLILLLLVMYVRKRIELLTQLKQSQTRLKNIFDSTKEGMVVIDHNGIIQSVNNAAQKLFKHAAHKMKGKYIGAFLKEVEGSEGFSIKELTSKKESQIYGVTIELEGIDSSGQRLPIEFNLNKSYTLWKDQFICTIHDISARKQAELALRNNMVRTTAIIDTVKDGIFTIDEQGFIQTTNPAIEKVFGYLAGEVEGQSINILIPNPHGSRHDYYLSQYTGSGKKAVIGQTRELVGKHKDGHTFPLELTVNEFFIDTDRYFTGVVRDISERKEAEEEIRNHRDNLQEMVAIATTEIKAIVQTAVNAVISIDQDGLIKIFNPAAEKMFGWSSSEVVGKNVALLIPNISKESHDGYIQRFLDTGIQHIIGSGREAEALRKDGHIFPAHIAVGHTQLSESKHIFVAFIADITEQKQAEKELIAAKDAAEQAVRAKANFLANMSHEIRTPMNAVIGFSELLLLEDDLKQENRDYVRTILSSGKNLLGIINDILDFSKVEAGHVELETVCFHLPNVMNDVIDTLEIAASEKNIELTLSIQASVPVRVFGDPSRLRQVVINLVSNAIKFTPSGNVTISIDKDNASGLVHFAVSDTGIGMSQDQVNKVFEAFSQADTSTNRRFGGTGLGTTISKQIVELMQGSIWIESQLGEGSTFHFTAKLEEAVTYEQCLFETEEYVQIDYISPRIFNVLLAEDIAANASLVTLRLEQQGHTVTWVNNGKLAVEAVKNNNFDLILMDVQMPEMDGLKASKLIRTQFESSQYRIPIIALTASVMKEDQQQCFEAGMDTIESKPIDFSALLSKMESIVRKERGTPNKTLIPSISTSTNQVDFSVLDSIVDYKQGVNTWRDPDVFVNALISFAESHKDDGQKITALLTLSTPDLDGARKISHALKGLAGNLSIIDVINISIELDELLKQKSIENAIEKSQELNTSLEQAALAISTLQLTSNEDNEPNKELDPIKVQALLDKIDSTLDELDPSAVMPYIEELSQYLDKAQLTEIEYFIDHFEFDSAKIEVQNLANRLGINKR